MRKKRGWIRTDEVKVGDDLVVNDDSVGIERAVTRVYILDAVETSYSSSGGKIDARRKSEYTRHAIILVRSLYQ